MTDKEISKLTTYYQSTDPRDWERMTKPTKETNEMTLNEDTEKQGHNVEDLIDLWQDTSEAVMRNPQTTREDLQEEIFKWIRRFREMHKDATRAESEVARLRNALNVQGH